MKKELFGYVHRSGNDVEIKYVEKKDIEKTYQLPEFVRWLSFELDKKYPRKTLDNR